MHEIKQCTLHDHSRIKRDIQTIGGQIIEVQLYYILYIHFGDQLILLGKSA